MESDSPTVMVRTTAQTTKTRHVHATTGPRRELRQARRHGVPPDFEPNSRIQREYRHRFTFGQPPAKCVKDNETDDENADADQDLREPRCAASSPT